MTQTVAEKRARFAELHQAPGCFVIPNPFDVGSAKYLASLGFPALATRAPGWRLPRACRTAASVGPMR